MPGTGTGCSQGNLGLISIWSVSMPSWAWVVTIALDTIMTGRKKRFNALMGLSCYAFHRRSYRREYVSMPSWAWVVTARISNILNFSWYFLCIPAIYRCILAYLPIFFNQLSKFLRCESPSTFLGTCLSHHSFIIFLVTNTNTLLSDLYLISTYNNCEKYQYHNPVCQCPLGLIPHFYKVSRLTSQRGRFMCQCPLGLIPHFYPETGEDVYDEDDLCVNALSGLYLISTLKEYLNRGWTSMCQCPLGLIPHFYSG